MCADTGDLEASGAESQTRQRVVPVLCVGILMKFQQRLPRSSQAEMV
jgi:hypothetical protein